MSEYVYEWFYMDPKGLEQGPFSLEQMQNWFMKGYFKDELKCKPSDSKLYVSLKDLMKRNGEKTPFVQKTTWSLTILKPKDTNKIMDENEQENQLELIINKLLEMDKRHMEDMKEIRHVLQRQNEKIAAIQAEWAIMKNKLDTHDHICPMNAYEQKEDEKLIEEKQEIKEEVEHLPQEESEQEDEEEEFQVVKSKRYETVQGYQSSLKRNSWSDEEVVYADGDYSEDEEKSSGFEDTRTNNSTPNTTTSATVTQSTHPKYRILASKSFASDGVSYFLNLKLTDMYDMFVTAHMYRQKGSLKREFTMKMDAVEQMADIFDLIVEAIEKEYNNAEFPSLNNTKTLAEFLPNEVKQKLRLENNKSNEKAATNTTLNGELTFEKSFKSFHWEYTIKIVRNGMFGDKGVMVICKHIKNKQTSIEFSYDGVFGFADVLKKILVSFEECKKNLSSKSSLKREFTMKMDAVEQMADIFDLLVEAIEKEYNNAEFPPLNNTKTLAEFLPNEVKQKLRLENNKSNEKAATNTTLNGELKFEKSFGTCGLSSQH